MTAPLPPGDLLREAARLMRERAEAATDSRHWTVGVLVVGNRHEEEDAEHIAGMRPAVALAVADWLDYTAQRHEGHGVGLALVEKALAVARAYLRSDDA